MNLKEAGELLDGATREELRDHAFGDAEVFWTKDGIEIANGFFGGGSANVYFKAEEGEAGVTFEGNEARELREKGDLVGVSRNDETGPESYSEGTVMPGLSLEDVRQELTGG